MEKKELVFYVGHSAYQEEAEWQKVIIEAYNVIRLYDEEVDDHTVVSRYICDTSEGVLLVEYEQYISSRESFAPTEDRSLRICRLCPGLDIAEELSISFVAKEIESVPYPDGD